MQPSHLRNSNLQYTVLYKATFTPDVVGLPWVVITVHTYLMTRQNALSPVCSNVASFPLLSLPLFPPPPFLPTPPFLSPFPFLPTPLLFFVLPHSPASSSSPLSLLLPFHPFSLFSPMSLTIMKPYILLYLPITLYIFTTLDGFSANNPPCPPWGKSIGGLGTFLALGLKVNNLSLF